MKASLISMTKPSIKLNVDAHINNSQCLSLGHLEKQTLLWDYIICKWMQGCAIPIGDYIQPTYNWLQLSSIYLNRFIMNWTIILSIVLT